MSGPSPSELLEVALGAGHAAAAALMEHFSGPRRGVSTKSSATDLVSDADREAERIIIGAITEARPQDGILAEEGGGRTGTSGIRWSVDPLDGTTNFLWRIPHWAVSIAASDRDGTLAAIVVDPNRGETFSATRGGGARVGDTPLRVTTETELDRALIGTGFNYSASERIRQAQRLTQTMDRIRDIRRFGAAALDLAWVAAGRLDGFFETGLEPWDWAAGALLITEAGGAVDVLPERDGSPACVIAGSRTLLPRLRRVVDEAYR